MAQVKFETTAADALIIRKIAKRAMTKLRVARRNDKFTAQDIEMDITATHCNGCPLRLDDLLKADDFNFAHDVLGIRRHLNRNTGKLMDMFSPRFRSRR